VSCCCAASCYDSDVKRRCTVWVYGRLSQSHSHTVSVTASLRHAWWERDPSAWVEESWMLLMKPILVGLNQLGTERGKSDPLIDIRCWKKSCFGRDKVWNLVWRNNLRRRWLSTVDCWRLHGRQYDAYKESDHAMSRTRHWQPLWNDSSLYQSAGVRNRASHSYNKVTSAGGT